MQGVSAVSSGLTLWWRIRDAHGSTEDHKRTFASAGMMQAHYLELKRMYPDGMGLQGA